jgi:hypothetical protein
MERQKPVEKGRADGFPRLASGGWPALLVGFGLGHDEELQDLSMGDKRVVKTATHGRLYCRSAGALFLQANSSFALESIDHTIEILLRLRADRVALEVA